MQILVDTNVLLRVVESKSTNHGIAISAVETLGRSHSLVIVPQIIYEFWSVATKTLAVNGLELSPAEADAAILQMSNFLVMLPDERGIFQHWRDCVRDMGIRGTQSYDARLYAAMKQHQISHILTFNGGHFRRFQDIIVIQPDDVVTGEKT